MKRSRRGALIHRSWWISLLVALCLGAAPAAAQERAVVVSPSSEDDPLAAAVGAELVALGYRVIFSSDSDHDGPEPFVTCSTDGALIIFQRGSETVGRRIPSDDSVLTTAIRTAEALRALTLIGPASQPRAVDDDADQPPAAPRPAPMNEPATPAIKDKGTTTPPENARPVATKAPEVETTSLRRTPSPNPETRVSLQSGLSVGADVAAAGSDLLPAAFVHFGARFTVRDTLSARLHFGYAVLAPRPDDSSFPGKAIVTMRYLRLAGDLSYPVRFGNSGLTMDLGLGVGGLRVDASSNPDEAGLIGAADRGWLGHAYVSARPSLELHENLRIYVDAQSGLLFAKAVVKSADTAGDDLGELSGALFGIGAGVEAQWGF